MFKNGHLRLLMTLVGFERLGSDEDPEASWIVPGAATGDQLQQSLDLIKKVEFSPPSFDDGQEAGDFIRRTSAGSAYRKRAAFDDDEDGINDEDEDEEPLFPVGGPTPMDKSDALKALKKTRRRRRKEGSEDGEEGISDEVIQARLDARRAKEREKNRKIKSELFVHDSDEEEDEERDRAFFAAEEKIRERAKITIMKELLGGRSDETEKLSLPKKKNKKRQSSAIAEESDDEGMRVLGSRKRHSSTISINSDEESEARSGDSSPVPRDNPLDGSDDEATDTPMSSPHIKSSKAKRRKMSNNKEDSAPAIEQISEGIESDDEEDVPVVRPARQRVRAGFIVDSSDEE